MAISPTNPLSSASVSLSASIGNAANPQASAARKPFGPALLGANLKWGGKTSIKTDTLVSNLGVDPSRSHEAVAEGYPLLNLPD